MDNGEMKYLESVGFEGEHALRIIAMKEEYDKPHHGRYNENVRPLEPA